MRFELRLLKKEQLAALQGFECCFSTKTCLLGSEEIF